MKLLPSCLALALASNILPPIKAVSFHNFDKYGPPSTTLDVQSGRHVSEELHGLDQPQNPDMRGGTAPRGP